MNVQDYFVKAIPTSTLQNAGFTINASLHILAEMPADTPCGKSCTDAIDACAAMSQHLSDALGSESPELVELWTLCVRTCVVYIRG